MSARTAAGPVTPLLSVGLATEHDVVLARQRARQVAALLDFDAQEQVRLATAVSEIARNAVRYAGGGRVELAVDEQGGAARLVVTVQDRGPGIRDLDAILDGRYESSTGMGLGLVGARRLVDHFDIVTEPGRGTTVVLARMLPRRGAPPAPGALARIAESLARQVPQGALAEVQAQNQELLRTLAELRERQAEVERLNRELEETNRGVVALYTEVDDKAAQLRRASELKSAFLSNVSHELRTPLSSILNISRLMADAGTLSDDDARHVTLIRRSAQSLFDIVNDLLDLAKIESGRTDVRAAPVPLADFLTALRGMFRPLLQGDAVSLVVDDPPAGLVLVTDEQKLSQVLRNLLSNAVKYTERGEVRLSVAEAEGDLVEFTVRDTGIGIAAGDLDRVFEEFTQVEGPLQRRVKGTGLGLPLVRQLTRLLGGTVRVSSEPGVGSTFVVSVPRQLGPPVAAPGTPLRPVGTMPAPRRADP